MGIRNKNKLRADLDEAMNARDSGDLGRARRLLARIHKCAPNSAGILLVLADTCWTLGHLDEALEGFRKATMLKPDSEVASLGLFHLLLKVDRIDEAFDEMRRFLSDYDSEEYTRLLADLKKPRTTRH